jgi:hypothetical protein
MAYTDSTALKTYLGVSGATDDALLTALIASAQAAIDVYTSRTFEAAADSTRYFTVGVDTLGRTLYLDQDLAAITTVKTNADDGSGGDSLATTDYITHPRNRTPYHALVIKLSSAYDWTYTDDPTGGITVTGKWAYSTSAPNDIVHACLRLAAYYYRQKDAGVFDTTAIPDAGIIQIPQGIPRDVQLILNPYVRATI